MLVAAVALVIGLQTPPGWISQKIFDGVSLASPRSLKKDPPDPKDKDTGDQWADRTGPVRYGIYFEKPDPKLSENEAISGFAQGEPQPDDKLESEQDLLFQGWRGKAIAFTQKNGRSVLARGIYYRGRVVEIWASFDSKSKRPPSAIQFLDSLRFAMNGTATTSLPPLTQYPIGDTGVSAGFTEKPEVDKGKSKNETPSFQATYGSLLLQVCCLPAALNREELSPSELREESSTDIDGFLGDPKCKTLAQHDLPIDGENGLYRAFQTSDGQVGAIVVVRHGKYIVFLSAAGLKEYDGKALTDAFFKSVRFTDKPPVGNAGPSTWNQQTIQDGITVSVLRKLTQEKPKQAPLLANTVQVWTEGDGELSYQMRIQKAPGQPAGLLLSDVVHGAMTRVDGTIDGEKDLLLHGWPGIAVTIARSDGVTVAIRAYVYDSELVATVAAYATANGRPPSVDKYLDSLHFPKDGTTSSAGPKMTLFPLADSGISAIFPMQPQSQDKPATTEGPLKGVTRHTFGSNYCGRVYLVSYFDLPPQIPNPTPRDRTDFFNDGLDELESEMKGKVTKQRDLQIGDDSGLYREISSKSKRCVVEILIHKRRILTLMVVEPSVYQDQASVDAFFKSLQL